MLPLSKASEDVAQSSLPLTRRCYGMFGRATGSSLFIPPCAERAPFGVLPSEHGHVCVGDSPGEVTGRAHRDFCDEHVRDGLEGAKSGRPTHLQISKRIRPLELRCNWALSPVEQGLRWLRQWL